MTCWRENFNLQLVIDVGNILDYMYKYVTKKEFSLTSQWNGLIQRIIIQSIGRVQSATISLKTNAKASW